MLNNFESLFIIGAEFITTKACGKLSDGTLGRCLAKNTVVRITKITPPHPKYKTNKKYYGPGVYITPKDKTNNNFGFEFYLSYNDLKHHSLKTLN